MVLITSVVVGLLPLFTSSYLSHMVVIEGKYSLFTLIFLSFEDLVSQSHFLICICSFFYVYSTLSKYQFIAQPLFVYVFLFMIL